LLSLSFLITFTVLIGIGIIGRLLRMHRRKWGRRRTSWRNTERN
jgi:hypothetical protein